MKFNSLSLSFRIPLAFHCLNNEGASGNVMEPRRISVKGVDYDGISGEMVRRHILENFVRRCEQQRPENLNNSPSDFALNLFQDCRGLQPERGKADLENWRRTNNKGKWDKMIYSEATKFLIRNCALSDLAGYLITGKAEAKPKTDKNAKGTVEVPDTAEETSGEDVEGAAEGGATLKRDSCFEFGWLISENPAIVEFTQQVAYKADQKHAPFTQNMRVGVYSGVFRFDLGRVGYNDWFWLSTDKNEKALVLTEEQRKARVSVFLDAMEEWLLSPSGARQAGWLQHQSGERDGIFCLSESGPAPFVSPLSLNLSDTNEGDPVFSNPDYRDSLKKLEKQRENSSNRRIKCEEFTTLEGVSEAFDAIRKHLELESKG